MALQEPEAIPRRVFVGGFDDFTTENELYEIFQACGPILIVNIIRNSTHRSYGFITFQFEQSAQLVLSQHYSFFIRGRKLRFSQAYLRNKSRPTYRHVITS